MLIPLGFLAASGVSAGSFDLLESQVLTSNTASITFSNLNSSYGSSYQHLQLRVLVRSNNAQVWEETKLTFNGSSTGYRSHILAGTGSGSPFSAWTDATDSYIKPWAFAVGANATANTFGAAVIDILDPFETTKNKTVKTLGGRVPSNGETRIALSSGLWANTAAVSSITIAPEAGSQWVQYSRFSLYGIKAA
jgi:hypothetical protein